MKSCIDLQLRLIEQGWSFSHAVSLHVPDSFPSNISCVELNLAQIRREPTLTGQASRLIFWLLNLQRALILDIHYAVLAVRTYAYWATSDGLPAASALRFF